MSYLIIGSIGFILAITYWWGIQKIFSTKQNSPAKVPMFSILIEGANIAIPPKPDNSTSFALNVSIDNNGEPSVAKDWNLKITIPGHEPQVAHFMRLGQVDKLEWKGVSGDAIILGKDALEDKTENTPIMGKIRGQLWFILEGIPKSKVINSNTALTLSAKDKDGHLHSITQTIADISKLAPKLPPQSTKLEKKESPKADIVLKELPPSPVLQLLNESATPDSVRRFSDFAFKYTAFLENSGIAPVKINDIYIEIAQPNLKPEWAIWIAHSSYLQSGYKAPIEWNLGWGEFDERSKKDNLCKSGCTITLVIRFYDEVGKLITKKRQIGGFTIDGNPMHHINIDGMIN